VIWSAPMADPPASDTARGADRAAVAHPATTASATLPPDAGATGLDPLQRDEMSETTVPMAVNVRSAAIAFLAVLAAIFVLRWASAVLIPLMLGLVLSYALTPVVDGLVRLHLPRLLASCLVIFGLVGSAGAGAYYLSGDVAELVEAVPEAARKLGDVLRRSTQTTSPITQIQEAADHIREATNAVETSPRPEPGVQVVRVERNILDVREYLWSGTLGLITLLGQFTVVVVLSILLLSSGDTFRRKLVRIGGTRLSEKKLTVQALNEISDQIQRYLLVQFLISVAVGIATWLSFLWIGLENAAVWGIAGGVMNMVPYIGPIVVTSASVLVAFLQFPDAQGVLLVAGAGLVIHLISGYVLVPWFTSRAARMSPVVVFVGVMGWGWLWGVWGLLLGIPILMIVKSVCDRVDDLKPIGELLGD
jgi:predicted PurR-regulated permease PerM